MFLGFWCPETLIPDSLSNLSEYLNKIVLSRHFRISQNDVEGLGTMFGHFLGDI